MRIYSQILDFGRYFSEYEYTENLLKIDKLDTDYLWNTYSKIFVTIKTNP